MQNEAVKWHLLPLAVGEGRSALRRWAKSLTGSAFSLHGVDVLPTRGRRPPYTGETGSLHGAAASSPCAGVGRQRFNSDARKMAFTRPFGLPSESFAFCGTFPFRLLSAAHESNCCFGVRSIRRSGNGGRQCRLPCLRASEFPTWNPKPRISTTNYPPMPFGATARQAN